MGIVLFAVIIGILISLFAIQNTNPVTLTVANYPFSSVPLFVVALASLIAGLVIGMVMNAITAASAFFRHRNRENQLNDASGTIAQLKQHVHELEAENARLREKADEPPVVDRQAEEDQPPHAPDFFTRIRESFR